MAELVPGRPVAAGFLPFDARNSSVSECGQATKGVRWMPWRQESMKDVASCDKLR